MVKEFTRADVGEIFGIRSILESYAAYLTTVSITPHKISILERKLADSQEALASGDLDAFLQRQTEFHDLIYKACKSKNLLGLINNYRDYFCRYRAAMLRAENGFQGALEDHRRMLEAMKKKDPVMVEKLVRQHLDRGKELLLKMIDEGKIAP